MRYLKPSFIALLVGLSISVSHAETHAQELGKPLQKPKWLDNIVAEFHGYNWFTDGNTTHRHLWDIGNPPVVYGFSHLKYDTDSNLYIIGGEIGYEFGLRFLKRITMGYETSHGSSDKMHGTDSDPAYSDPGLNNFLGYLSFQKHSGKDSTKYINASVYFRPVEGAITKHIDGHLDLVGEWIRYKDNVDIKQVEDVIPGTSGIFEVTEPNPWQTRYEGAGLGFRGGLRFFNTFKLEGLFAYYPAMSVKRTLLWDEPTNRKFVFYGKDETGFKGRITLGFTPPVKPFKERKNLEFEFGYQYMQFEQHGGRGRVFRFSDGAGGNIDNWERAKSWRDGFFIGGTIRW